MGESKKYLIGAVQNGGTPDRIIKVATIIGSVSIATAAILAWKSPATSYESSIYSATPTIVWVFLAIPIICGRPPSKTYS